jgi:Terminase RNaseH-like domain
MIADLELTVHQRTPHPAQRRFIESKAKRKIIRAGRRSGKTTGIAHFAVEQFLKGRRILYATPTGDQIERFWYEVKLSLEEPIDAGIYYKNETRHIIDRPGTEQRIRAKTAWNADTLRGDYADVLIFDEWQLMNEDAWEIVGAPMLLDNNGDAVFIYTPPRPHSRSTTKATDPMHAAKLFKFAQADKSGRWQAFHFTSHDNPHISKEALAEITKDMTRLAYQMEIEAIDLDHVPGALWTFEVLDNTRVTQHPPLHRIAVGVDPAATTGQTGIVVAGIAYIGNQIHGYTLDDATAEPGAKPGVWAGQAVAAYHRWKADIMVGEINNGGAMVENTIRQIDGGDRVNYKTVHASRGKYTRAEPISALFDPPEQVEREPRGHMVGIFADLEEELCSYVPGHSESPNRLDAMVWAFTELMVGYGGQADWQNYQTLGSVEGYENRWE